MEHLDEWMYEALGVGRDSDFTVGGNIVFHPAQKPVPPTLH